MKTMIIDIDGMSCEHCVRHVTEALEALSGVAAVTVSLADKQASMQTDDGFDEAAARDAVDEAGYEITGIRAA
ncbi:MAG TPA: heavy-metal-associated domain-containing protein [Gammaproteobacteria bacterium]|jgi:copper chaperone CopZ